MSNCVNLPSASEASALIAKINSKELEKLMQVIPSEMLNFIKQAAIKDGRSLDDEIMLRLLTTLINPSAFGLSILLDTVMNKKFTEVDAKAEKTAREKGWMHVYQMEKLKLYVEFEKRLPKKFKENFQLENFEEELKKVKAEIAVENSKNNDDKE